MSYCKFVENLDLDHPHKVYHDREYGFPIHDDNELFGRLILEINQAGLSWSTILNKKENFRNAYSNFSIDKIAAYTEKDRNRLLSDAGIIRNKLKVNAAIHNARQVRQLQDEFGSFKNWLDQHHPLPKEKWVKLFKKTFKFTGGEITNEFLMSTGYLKGAHEEDCNIHAQIISKNPMWNKQVNLKKIGIIGSGAVAKSLGTGFLKHGYDVMLGSRDVSKLNDWKNENPEGHTGTFEETADFGQIVVLAVAGRHASSALQIIGSERLKGKTVIDTTNPISEEAPQDGVLQFFTDLDESLLEKLQNQVQVAHFVKAFNSVGSAFMVDPSFESKPTMFICGNNEKARKEVATILEEFGWEVEDMGMAKAARSIEPLCMLWCIPGFLQGRWSHAFKLLKK